MAAVLTGTAAIIGSRGQMKGPMRLEAPGAQAQCSFCNLEARKVRHLVAIGRLVRLLQDPDGYLVTRRVAVLPWDRLLEAEERPPKRESCADPM